MGESTDLVLERIIADALRALLDAAEINRLPVDVHRVAQRLGIRVAVHPLESREALFLRTPREARIFLDPKLFNDGFLSARGRFSLAHEIGHCAFEEQFKKQSALAPLSHHERELIADRLANQLLMPRELLTHELRRLQQEWTHGEYVEASTMVKLQHVFRVSLPALAHAIRELSPNTAILRFEKRPIRERGRDFGEVTYRVAWSSPLSTKGERVFPNQTLARCESLAHAAAHGETVKMRAPLNFRPLPRREYSVTGAPHRLVSDAAYLLSIDIQGDQRKEDVSGTIST
jgi:hypothetical protein